MPPSSFSPSPYSPARERRGRDALQTLHRRRPELPAAFSCIVLLILILIITLAVPRASAQDDIEENAAYFVFSYGEDQLDELSNATQNDVHNLFYNDEYKTLRSTDTIYFEREEKE